MNWSRHTQNTFIKSDKKWKKCTPKTKRDRLSTYSQWIIFARLIPNISFTNYHVSLTGLNKIILILKVIYEKVVAGQQNRINDTYCAHDMLTYYLSVTAEIISELYIIKYSKYHWRNPNQFSSIYSIIKAIIWKLFSAPRFKMSKCLFHSIKKSVCI